MLDSSLVCYDIAGNVLELDIFVDSNELSRGNYLAAFTDVLYVHGGLYYYYFNDLCETYQRRQGSQQRGLQR